MYIAGGVGSSDSKWDMCGRGRGYVVPGASPAAALRPPAGATSAPMAMCPAASPARCRSATAAAPPTLRKHCCQCLVDEGHQTGWQTAYGKLGHYKMHHL